MTLKSARMMRGVSTVELSKIIGFSKQRLNYIESKGIEHCREETARKLAGILQMNLFDLCEIEKLLCFVPKTKEEWDIVIRMAEQAKEKCAK